MPNHCQNKLVITGKEKSIDKLMKEIINDNDNFDFEKIIKPPKTHYELIKKYPQYYVEDSHTYWGKEYSPTWMDRHFDWYRWNLDHWGTKKNAMDTNVIRNNKNKLTIWFDTAWNEPEPVIEELTNKYPNLKIEWNYYEAGCGFGGTYVNGLDISYEGDLEEWAIKKGFEDRF